MPRRGTETARQHPVTAPTTGGARRSAVLAGYSGDERRARGALDDADGDVRAAALGALSRLGALGTTELVEALGDPAPAVRRRACELSVHGAQGRQRAQVLAAVRRLLTNEMTDPVVLEAACFAVGERADRRSLGALRRLAGDHPDPRVREAAVAALGAIGDPRGAETVLDALADKPAVRRRAAVALAAFDGQAVEEALRRCLEDRDWQVRQVAEELLAGET